MMWISRSPKIGPKEINGDFFEGELFRDSEKTQIYHRYQTVENLNIVADSLYRSHSFFSLVRGYIHCFSTIEHLLYFIIVSFDFQSEE